MKTAVIFARVYSTGERQTNDRQVADLTNHAKAMGMSVINTFEEKISGAKANNERPILTECIEYCKANDIGTLLVSELSRLGRRTYEILETIKYLVDNKINLYCKEGELTLLDEDKNPNMCTPVIITVLAMCTEIERKNIYARLNSGKLNYVAKGGKVGCKLGYKKSKDRKKEQYAKVINCLKNGYTIKDAADLGKISMRTVNRLKIEFADIINPKQKQNTQAVI